MNMYTLSLLVGVAALLALPTAAQQSEPALARVIYEFTHVKDTLQPDKPHKEEMVLYIGQHATLYGTYTSERMNQQMIKQVEDPAFDGNITITGSGPTTRESYYAQPAEQVLKQLSGLAGDKYLIEDEYPVIEWQLTDETKTIGGYTVQQATGRFKGRDYTAWFTTEVPFQAGPWKLLGLPGLVLEASDSRQHVLFHYAGFETLAEGEATVPVPENAIATTRKELDKLTAAFNKNPQAFMNARAQAGARNAGGGGGASINGKSVIDPSRIKSINVKKDDSQTSNVTNNPLELEQ